ncbi:unnamed protein product [Microthlaspi erraticum]|uniref:Uncharacterized protein n=1 Tax=Microthlaspi erraticum TaxID=1685480 RepID=A0A6D2ICN2_9BRAS|nr:unnamed protein product [Microthlaspi erraticum]
MKTGAIITLMISFLLAAKTTSGENEIVLDFWGSPVKPNTWYFAQTEVIGGTYISRFKVPLVPIFHSLSPETAVFTKTSSSFLIHPLPIMFVLSSDVVVRVSTELNIKFAFPSACNETGFWQVRDDFFSQHMVHLMGTKSASDSTFTIKKSDDKVYKFAFGGTSVDPSDNSTDIVSLKENGPPSLGRLKMRNPELKISFFKYFP